MTAHDPRVTLTDAGRPYVFAEKLWTAIVEVRDAAPRVANDADTDDIVSAILPLIHAEIDKLVAARLAPIRALAEEWRYKGDFGWGAWQEGQGPDLEGWVLDIASSRLRAVLDAPVSASQDHDGAEGRGEGEKAPIGLFRHRDGRTCRLGPDGWSLSGVPGHPILCLRDHEEGQR